MLFNHNVRRGSISQNHGKPNGDGLCCACETKLVHVHNSSMNHMSLSALCGMKSRHAGCVEILVARATTLQETTECLHTTTYSGV